MSYAICNQAFYPLRKEAAHKSEMVSMILFGELYEILESKADWHWVRCFDDGYTGWLCLQKPLSFEDDPSHYEYSRKLLSDNFGTLHSKVGDMIIGFGSWIPSFNGIECRIGKYHYRPSFSPVSIDEGAEKNRFSLAYRLLGTPYLWGGRSAFGIDCSGLIQLLFRFEGIQLPRDAYQQAELGESPKNPKSGDLAFFVNKAEKVVHTGLILENDQIIHACEYVRIDRLDEKGIYHENTQKYTHQLHSIKRISPNI